MEEIVNAISYKLMVLIMQKREGLDHIGGANENSFEFTPSVMLENALMVCKTDNTLIIHVVLLWHFNHICFTE